MPKYGPHNMPSEKTLTHMVYIRSGGLGKIPKKDIEMMLRNGLLNDHGTLTKLSRDILDKLETIPLPVIVREFDQKTNTPTEWMIRGRIHWHTEVLCLSEDGTITFYRDRRNPYNQPIKCLTVDWNLFLFGLPAQQ